MSIDSKKGIIWLAGGEGIGRLGVFSLTAIAAHLLSEVEFARYVVLWTLVGFVWSLAQLGTGLFGIRVLSVEEKSIAEKKSILGNMLILRLGLACFWVGFVFLFRNFIAHDVSVSVLLLALSLIFLRASTMDWAVRAYNLYKGLAILTITSTIFLLVFSYGCIKLNPSAKYLFFAHVLAAIVLSSGTWILLKNNNNVFPSFSNLHRTEFISMFRGSSVIGLAGIALVGSQALPLLALNVYAGASQVAAFGGIQRILQLGLGILYILSVAHFPQLAMKNKSASMAKVFHQYLSDLIIASIWLFVGFFLFSNVVIRAILGANYVSDSWLLELMLFLLPVYFFRMALTDTMIASGDGRIVLYISALSLVVSAIISYIVLPNVSPGVRVMCAFWALAAAEITVVTIVCLFLIRGAYSRVLQKLYAPVCFSIMAFIFIGWLFMRAKAGGSLVYSVCGIVIAVILSSVWIKSSSIWLFEVKNE